MQDNMLFEDDFGPAGYRLQCVEIYNWGVFDKEIYKISPEGNTSLLTGANGSGKTSFVDAILTLIVPERRMRFYNFSSGSTTRNERTEESYVLGEFGDAESDENGKQTLRLRPDKEKTFSILLARFRNVDKFLTLAQVRWFSGSELRRAYILAHASLTIKDDFIPFDATGFWRRNLRNKYPKVNNREVIEFYDGPAVYANSIRRNLGMRSEKALTLFSQTVGLKVLGNLNDFIRQNMLQESNIEDEFVSLKEGFSKLLNAHTEIEKAKQQLDLLQPIIDRYNDLQVLRSSYTQLNEYRDTLPPFFATKKRALLELEVDEAKRKNSSLAEILLGCNNDINIKREQEKEIDADIRNDEVGKRIQSMQHAILLKQNVCDAIKQRCGKYNQAASAINLIQDPSDYEFAENIDNANIRFHNILNDLPEFENQWSDSRSEIKKMVSEVNDLRNEFSSLQKHKNNITGRIAEIRSEIIDYCGVTEEEIPFIGELIQVNEDEKDWEFAIEKLLSSYALRLIVPEEYYDRVNHYVNNTNLRGRIVYQKLTNKDLYTEDYVSDFDNSVFSKLDIKNESPYSEWLKSRLKTEFDYLCTDDMDVFSSSRRALTSNGLVKNNNRHEKDDRNTSRERFVLGWDNSSKLNHTLKLMKLHEEKLTLKESTLAAIKAKIDSLHKEKEAITAFLQFDKFEDIDWPLIAVEISEMENQKRALEKSNNHVEELSAQLKQLKNEIKELEKKKDGYTTDKVRAQDYLDKVVMQYDYLKTMLDAYRHINLNSKFETFSAEFAEMLSDINPANIDNVRHKVETEIQRKLTETKDVELRIMNRISNLMRDFREPSEDIRRKFIDWVSDTHKLPVEIDYIQEYIDIYNNINEQQLTEYKARFKHYLNEDMINRMTNFIVLLERQEEEIKDNIEALNYSLEKITFRNFPRTYIQLYAEKESSREIRDFRMRLNNWKPDMDQFNETQDENILEESFEKIKSLIDDLSDNDNWRKSVTDVRNWFTFKAKEHLEDEDGKIYKVYESTGKLSGGEKAQLTYTILGSAIAYQFGISQKGDNTDSFRFICVDESFSNQDDEKSRYLMELCRQLHLQLLVVTPEDKMHIVEPYISAIHFVKRSNNRNSIVFDMPIRKKEEEAVTA